MNFKDLATQVLMNKIGGANSSADASAALDSLTDGSRDFDLGEIVAKFQAAGGDIESVAKSWLGDGANDLPMLSTAGLGIGTRRVQHAARSSRPRRAGRAATIAGGRSRQPIGAGSLAGPSGSSAYCPRYGQPPLAICVRGWTGQDVGGLWRDG